MADIIGVSGCSLESPVAAASESLDSLLLLLLFEFELLFEFALLFELLLEFELEFPPPTKFCIKSCNLPHSTGLAGKRQAIKQSEQAIIVANLMVPIDDDLRCLLVMRKACCCLTVVVNCFALGIVLYLSGLGVLDGLMGCD